MRNLTQTQQLIELVSQLSDAEIVEMIDNARVAHIVHLRLKELRLRLVKQAQPQVDQAEVY